MPVCHELRYPIDQFGVFAPMQKRNGLSPSKPSFSPVETPPLRSYMSYTASLSSGTKAIISKRRRLQSVTQTAPAKARR